ncbi:type II secretion system protein [Candidatus Nitronereus thalassa]|uniref:Type II secretion system protein n=1 Tax=Candidatus Nitronereus thalassa TaxID=3020898 RepID=A0ABU3K7L1_9BACT|nr:type II secretion system protein [Candidatus Nitronereus thalassa]MDT7042363.1 type II secretion system protein [Candidatus Nitronereus thalassa]
MRLTKTRNTRYEIRDTLHERQATSVSSRNTKYEIRNTLSGGPSISLCSRNTSDEIRDTSPERPATSDERRLFLHEIRDTKYELRSSHGFSLLEVVGVLAVVGILAAIILPNFINRLDDATRTAEKSNLQAIAQAIELSLQETHAWPADLSALSPKYLQMGDTRLLQNDRGFPRYYVLHPTMAAFSNAAGIAENEIPDTRYLLISNLNADAAPTITNATEFDAWWNTNETSTPDLFIERGSVGHLFRLVNLLADTTGGSYSIDGTVTNSGCGITLSHLRYHLIGTRVGVDEAIPYAVPEIQFIANEDTTHHFNPCRPAGVQWRSGPILVQACSGGVSGCGSGLGGILLATFGDVGSPSGAPGLDSWTNADVLRFSDPNLALEPGTTNGTFSSLQNFRTFSSGGLQIDAVDYVKTGVTVGTTTTFDLLPGDLLLSTEFNATLTSLNTLSVTWKDVFVFRPATPGDYSSGTFYMLLENPINGIISGISVVEKNTLVGDVILPAGTFLYASSKTGRNDIHHYVPTSVGAGSTSGTTAILLEGSDINIDNNRYVYGVYLVEDTTTMGGRVLLPGTILATLDWHDATVGTVPISVQYHDIFALNAVTTTMGITGNTTALASIVLEGNDVGLNTTQENIAAVTLAE